MAAIAPSASVGTMTPASPASICSSSSCRFRKYHGAFDGFGVWFGLACAVNGALNSTEAAIKISRKTVAQTASTTTSDGQTITSSSARSVGRASARPRTSSSSFWRFASSIAVAGDPPGICCAISAIASPTESCAHRAPVSRQSRHHQCHQRIADSPTPIIHHPSLQGTGDAAVLADTPEVDRHQEGRHERQEDDVQRIEADQGVLPDLEVTTQYQIHLFADQWRSATNICADRDCPKRQLIPR